MDDHDRRHPAGPISDRPTHRHRPHPRHQRNAKLQLTVVLAPAEAVPGCMCILITVDADGGRLVRSALDV